MIISYFYRLPDFPSATMIVVRTASRRAISVALLFLLAIVTPAFAQESNGDSVAQADALDVDHYEQEVAGMLDTTDTIVADYAQGDDVTHRVDELVDTWENVDFHEALETNAILLYPPIWIALGGLREAVDVPGAVPDARQWQSRLNAALYEALGALKLVASRPEASAAPTSTAGDDDRPTITIIQDNLNQVGTRYRNGDADGARTLIHQTYMQRFEGVEGDLIEQDADLVTDLEMDFNATLPLLIDKSAPADKVDAQIETMNGKLDRAQTLMDKVDEDRGSVF